MTAPSVRACPACGGELATTQLSCRRCSIRIAGDFASSPFARLSDQQQEFVKTFLAARGNIKLVERRLGISYPTVRSRLEAVQRALGLPDLAAGEEDKPDLSEILSRVESGELSVDDAVDKLG
jgi:hypothetical protein